MLNVDKIVTISLRENKIRQQSALHEINKLNLNTEFLLVDRDVENGERGCFNSHVTACKNALEENCQNILIFEDDIKIRPFKSKQINAINHFIKNHQDFDLLFLGFIVKDMWYCGEGSSIVRAIGCGSHGYILSRQGMEKIARYQYTGVAIDELIKLDLKCYSVFPIIADQYSESVLKSDLTFYRKLIRQHDEVKNDYFWRKNYFKQWPVLLLNWQKTVNELFFKAS